MFCNDRGAHTHLPEWWIHKEATGLVLTNVVATESGNTEAVMANAAVVAAEAPTASTMRIVNDRAMKSRCFGTRSSSLKHMPQSVQNGHKLTILVMWCENLKLILKQSSHHGHYSNCRYYLVLNVEMKRWLCVFIPNRSCACVIA